MSLTQQYPPDLPNVAPLLNHHQLLVADLIHQNSSLTTLDLILHQRLWIQPQITTFFFRKRPSRSSPTQPLETFAILTTKNTRTADWAIVGLQLFENSTVIYDLAGDLAGDIVSRLRACSHSKGSPIFSSLVGLIVGVDYDFINSGCRRKTLLPSKLLHADTDLHHFCWCQTLQLSSSSH